GASIEVSDLPDYIFSERGRPGTTAPSDREALEAALERSGGNKTLAAKNLGISRVTLWKRMKRLGLN
ncbi:MAG: helix-turn-helix domain-containing protein, partial [Nitrospirota bacterium]